MAKRKTIDDAPPQERVRGVCGPPGVARRRALVHLALAAPPDERAGDGLSFAFGEPDTRMSGRYQGPPHPPVVLPRPRDESRTLPGLGVQRVERA